MTSEECFREATRLKRAGDFDGAVEKVREAIALIPPSPTSWAAISHVSLAQALASAGRDGEAWEEFNWILSTEPPEGMRRSAVFSDMAHVLDKMRLFLQRIGRADMAVCYGVAKELAEIRSIHVSAIECDERGRSEGDWFREAGMREMEASTRRTWRDEARNQRKRLTEARRAFSALVGGLLLHPSLAGRLPSPRRRAVEKDICQRFKPMLDDPSSFDPNAVVFGVGEIMGVS